MNKTATSALVMALLLAACEPAEDAGQKPVEVDPGAIDPNIYKGIERAPAPLPPPSITYPQRIDFDPVFMSEENGASTQTIRQAIRNAGGTLSPLGTLTLTGSNAFTLDQECPEELAPGNACLFSISYLPTTTGQASATLQFSDGTEVYNIPVSGAANRMPTPPPPPPPAAPPPPPPPPTDPLKDAIAAQLGAFAAPRSHIAVGRRPSPSMPAGIRPAKDDPKYRLEGETVGGDGEQAVGDLPIPRCRIITEDMIIELVLERSFNTQIGGKLVAYLDYDVKGYDGRLALLQRGTRFMSEVEPLENPGDTRVPADFYRAIQPDGQAIAINAKGYDIMGRPGFVGDVDNRWLEKYGTVAGATGIAAAIAYLTSSEANSELEAANNALQQNVGTITAEALRSGMNLAPRVTLAKAEIVMIAPGQGTDWYFPTPGQLEVVPSDGPRTDAGCEPGYFTPTRAQQQNKES